jgi:hypothetical protein
MRCRVAWAAKAVTRAGVSTARKPGRTDLRRGTEAVKHGSQGCFLLNSSQRPSPWV